jgi:hypothetical protein
MVFSLTRVLGTVALAAIATASVAQETSTNRVAAKTDWSVFVEDNPTECWAVTTFKESVNTKGGRVVAVTRGDILLYVFYRPGSGMAGQIAFTGGYPFAKESGVSMNVDGNEFQLITEGEWAWPAPDEDAKIVAAMKRGAQAVLTAQSSRGTTTKDTFSLLGFTAAVEEAAKRCGG